MEAGFSVEMYVFCADVLWDSLWEFVVGIVRIFLLDLTFMFYCLNDQFLKCARMLFGGISTNNKQTRFFCSWEVGRCEKGWVL